MKCIGSLLSHFSNYLWDKINAKSAVASTKSSNGCMIAATELDSHHADSLVVGKNAVILEPLDKSV